MNRDWLLARSVAALALASLTACAGTGASNATPTDEGSYEGKFPARADLIDDIRNSIGGSATPGTGTGSVGGAGTHGDPPLILTTFPGPFAVDSADMATGTLFYPTNAQPPFAGMALCGGFLNFGPEMADWGSFYASWGIVTVITFTSPIDLPDDRAYALAASVEEMKSANSDPGSPLYGKMNGRYGTSGYSMGGGGTTVATQADPSLKSSIGMAAWLPTGLGVTTPTLLMCGDIDIVAGCDMSEWAYNEIPESTPKLYVMMPGGVDHFGWFGPGDSGLGGQYGLAFAKIFLEGDERWKPLLLGLGGDTITNIY
jgi:hypothetical protein